jgi:hypothetical protein
VFDQQSAIANQQLREFSISNQQLPISNYRFHLRVCHCDRKVGRVADGAVCVVDARTEGGCGGDGAGDDRGL